METIAERREKSLSPVPLGPKSDLYSIVAFGMRSKQESTDIAETFSSGGVPSHHLPGRWMEMGPLARSQFRSP